MLLRHFGKIIYLAVCLLVILCILHFENSVTEDRKNFCNIRIQTMEVKVENILSEKDGTVFVKAKPSRESKIKNSVYISIDNCEKLNIYPGDYLTLSGKIQIPEKPLNPGGYDFGAYLKSSGMSLIFKSDISRIQNHKPSVISNLYKVRDGISDKISYCLPPDEAGIVNAIVTGDKSKITDEIKTAYAKAGIYHLVAVSGLHLNMVILALMFLYMSINTKKRIKNIISFAVTVVACLFILVFTGFGMSVARAVIMASLLCGSTLVYREYSPAHSLFWAFVLILITEPYAYANVSFCLSFSATAGIILGVNIVKKYNIDSAKFGYILSSVVLSVCSAFTTLPFVISAFGKTSVISPVSNLAALSCAPFLLGVSYIFAIMCAFLPAGVCYAFSGIPMAIAKLVNLIAYAFSAIPGIYLPLTPNLTVLLFSGGMCILFYIISTRRHWRIFICLFFIIANIFNISYNGIKDCTEAIFINASQGDSSVIRTDSGKCVMIDCGSEDAYDFASREIMGFLSKRNIAAIDILFITHFHTDHTNGIVTLMENKMVKKLILPYRGINADEENSACEIFESAAKFNIPIVYARENDKIVFEKDHIFTIQSLICDKDNTNNSSMVISYSYGNNKILFTGDIEEEAQYVLKGITGRHDIVKVPHHGGHSSMSHKLAKTLKPDYAVISCGKDNKYSHPAEDTLKAYSDCRILRTDKEGAPVVFSLTKNKIIPR